MHFMVHTHTFPPSISVIGVDLLFPRSMCLITVILGSSQLSSTHYEIVIPSYSTEAMETPLVRKATVSIFPSPMDWLHPACLQSSIWHSWPPCLLLSWLLHKYFIGFPSYFVNSFSVSYAVSSFSPRPLNIWIPQHSVLGWCFPIYE